jgi:heat shock protein HtpX
MISTSEILRSSRCEEGNDMMWRLKTVMMFAFMTVLLTAIGTLFGWMFGNIWWGMVAMLVVSVLFSIYSVVFSKNNALRANGVHLVTEDEEPRLCRIVASIAEKAGIPMPEVGVTETQMLNAFACGRGPKDAAVVATRGLLNALPDDELEGVLAHEVSHVKNRDVLVMCVAATMASVISYLARMAVWMSLFNRNDREGNNGIMFLLAILLELTLPIAALLVQMGVSRNREYLADESGAKITGNPRALAKALARLERGPEIHYDNPSYAHLWIESPTGHSPSLAERLFSTHPPTEKRIARLNEMAESEEFRASSDVDGYPLWEQLK